MPELNGLQAIPLIKKVALSAEILILTQYDNLFLVREGFIAGAAGFLTKGDVPTGLVIAVREVFAKRNFVSKSITSRDRTGGCRTGAKMVAGAKDKQS